MKLGRRSSNIEDRRGMGVPLVAGGGLGAVVLALVVMFLGGDPNEVLQQTAPQGQTQEGTVGAPQDEGGDFVAAVLGDTEDAWNAIFREQLGREYEEPRLVLFSDMVQSECGMGQAASGPFYCPLDRKVYIDLAFYRELRERFGAPGDFAQAYVISHEVGHHVQTLLGISQQVHSARSQVSREEGNELSVRQELQADCFAGVWANHTQKMRNFLEPGDLEEALNAASSIGDDRIQKQTQGRVSPESWTHGSSAQRVRWFRQGFEVGDMRQCDTFDATSL
jgi:predicted metalloprotease